MPTPSAPLIPGLPDEIAGLILASIPYAHHARLRATSRSWRSFLSARRLLPFRRLLRLPPLHLLCLFPGDPAVFHPYLFDPSAAAWSPLPLLPGSLHSYALSNFIAISSGPHLYLLGGSQFDPRIYPSERPSPSAAAHHLDFTATTPHWSRLPDMITPRGSFACATVCGGIVVAGGGSRHTTLPSEGTVTNLVELYDAAAGDWRHCEVLPEDRAGCVGFVVPRRVGEGEEGEEELWVMGGYGNYHVLNGIFPSSIYYRDAVALGMRTGKWREVGEMWEAGERHKLGSVAAVYGNDGHEPGIYMLDHNTIFRYDFGSNRWWQESELRRKIPEHESCGFVAMNGELYVLTARRCPYMPYPRRPPKERSTLQIQVYNPEKKKWRFLKTKPPFQNPIDFKTAVSCTIQL